jgi:Autophagy protein ATG17-like domain
LQNVIQTLDNANSRLVSTMNILRSTMVEAAFRPAGETPRSLLDFVDEQGVETVRNTIKESIRQSKVCRFRRFSGETNRHIGIADRIRHLPSLLR